MRDKKRDGHRFDDELVHQLAQRFDPVAGDDVRRVALRHCLAELPDALRLPVSQRYTMGTSIRNLTERFGKSEPTLKVALSRIRKQLLDCIEKKWAMDL